MNKKERILIFILAGVNFTHILDFMIMMPLNPQLSAHFHINQFQFNLLVSSYAISAFASGIVAAFFVDGFDRKKVLLYGYIGFLAGTLCCALAPTYHLLMLARIVAGLFGGVIGAQVLSIVGDTFSYDRRATAMGYLTAAFSVASVFGVPMGLFLATKTNWHAPFLFVAAVGSVIAILIIRFIPSMTKHLEDGAKRKVSDAFMNVYENKNMQRALLLSIVLMIGHFSVIPTIAAYMVHNVGLTKEQLPYIYFCGGLATLVTSPLIGKVADKKGKFPVFAFFALLCAVPVFFITNLPPVQLGVALSITSVFFIFVSGRMIPMQAMIASVVTPQQRGGFMSINSSFIQLGSGMAGIISGMIISEDASGKIENYNYVGYLAIAITIICVFIAKGLKPVQDTR
ncbi:MAG: MFS transporter [Chitinophagales bacterium]